MLKKVKRTIKNNQLLQTGDRVLVGVSGGPDSVALLHILLRVQKEYRLSIYVAHLNHLLRKEAGEDAAFVCDLARTWNLPVSVGKCDVAALARTQGFSLEEAGRRERYQFLCRVARRIGADKVAVGHHADDQAETVLMNLLRGAALSGLKGMLPLRGKIIRPLLEVSRQEIEAYCREQMLETRHDSTNEQALYRRNKIRLQLMPFLEKQYNRNIKDVLCHTAAILREEDAYLEAQTNCAWIKVAVEDNPEGVCLLIGKLISLPMALQRRLIRRAYRKLVGEGDLSYQHVEKVRMLAQGESGKREALPGKIWAIHEYDKLRIVPQRREKVKCFSCTVLNVPGQTVLPFLKSRLQAQILTSFSRRENEWNCSPDKACLDYDQLSFPLRVRMRKAGDFFQPLGLEGRKKIKDFFIDLKLSPEEKERIPLVVNADDQIVWVVGYRIDNRYRVTPQSKKILHLILEKDLDCG